MYRSIIERIVSAAIAAFILASSSVSAQPQSLSFLSEVTIHERALLPYSLTYLSAREWTDSSEELQSMCCIPFFSSRDSARSSAILLRVLLPIGRSISSPLFALKTPAPSITRLINPWSLTFAGGFLVSGIKSSLIRTPPSIDCIYNTTWFQIHPFVVLSVLPHFETMFFTIERNHGSHISTDSIISVI